MAHFDCLPQVEVKKKKDKHELIYNVVNVSSDWFYTQTCCFCLRACSETLEINRLAVFCSNIQRVGLKREERYIQKYVFNHHLRSAAHPHPYTSWLVFKISECGRWYFLNIFRCFMSLKSVQPVFNMFCKLWHVTPWGPHQSPTRCSVERVPVAKTNECLSCNSFILDQVDDEVWRYVHYIRMLK